MRIMVGAGVRYPEARGRPHFEATTSAVIKTARHPAGHRIRQHQPRWHGRPTADEDQQQRDGWQPLYCLSNCLSHVRTDGTLPGHYMQISSARQSQTWWARGRAFLKVELRCRSRFRFQVWATLMYDDRIFVA
jgi:hypothetical protein